MEKNDATIGRDDINLSGETRRISESHRRAGVTDQVPTEERVELYPLDSYKPTSFLAKTASGEELTLLSDLLKRLHAVNDEHVGIRTREAEVSLFLSGRAEPMAEEFRQWVERYLSRRLHPAERNPRDEGDPLRTYSRVLTEYDKILGDLNGRKGSVNYVFLERATAYARWLAYQRTWRSHVVERPTEQGIELFLDSRGLAASSVTYAKRLLETEGQFFISNSLKRFLDHLSPSISWPALGKFELETDEGLTTLLEDLVDDVQQMRSVLVSNFHPQKSAVRFREDAIMSWNWSVRGIGVLSLARDERQLRAFSALGLTKSIAVVNRNGLLEDRFLPWLDPFEPWLKFTSRPMATTAYVLELMRDKLFELYERIDFTKIEQPELTAQWKNDEEDRQFTASLTALAQLDSEPLTTLPKIVPVRLRSVRQLQLLNLLTRKFGCEVDQGKGSEITIYRRGGKKFILASHRRNRPVPPHLIRALLNRVGISPREWYQVAHG